MTVYGFVGIDIAKDTFTAAFLRVDALQGHILSEQVADFPYTQEGWQHFLQTWQTFQADRWWVGLEASGPYSALLETHLSRLTQPAFTLHRLSPAQVRDFARSRSRRRAKTDRLDARTLAHFLRQQVTTQALSPARQPDETPNYQALVRLEEQLIKEISALQNQVRQHLHFLFPELERQQARFSKALRTLLRHFPSAEAIAQASPEELAACLPKRHRLDLAALHKLARESFGLHDPVRARVLQELLDLWQELEARLDHVRTLLIEAVSQAASDAMALLLAIPGIGPLMAARFLALVGDIRRFPSAKALVAFAGLDVIVYASGRYQGRRRLSKRGHPALRHLLYLMAVSLKRHTRRFQAAFHHYRAQGRRVRETFVILARKALIMLYTLLTTGRHFQDLPPQGDTPS